MSIPLSQTFIQQLYRNAMYALTCIALVSIIISCNENKMAHQENSQDSSQMQSGGTIDTLMAGKATQPVITISEDLYRFCIKNPPQANNELKRFLGPADDNHAKMVFQFHHSRDGSLGLHAWSGKKKNEAFDKTPKPLNRTTPNIKDESLAGKDVYLSDLQINDIGKLRERVNTPGTHNSEYDFILFIPQITREPGGTNHVTYKIIGSRSQTISKETIERLAEITFANPSPPRGVDE